jgi:hypothetical protein
MFILLKLRRFCYFKVGKKSERHTVIFIIVRGVIARINLAITFCLFPSKTIVITNVLCEFFINLVLLINHGNKLYSGSVFVAQKKFLKNDFVLKSSLLIPG